MWAVRPINAAQRRPQTVQIKLLDGAASLELEFAARALRRLRFSTSTVIESDNNCPTALWPVYNCTGDGVTRV